MSSESSIEDPVKYPTSYFFFNTINQKISIIQVELFFPNTLKSAHLTVRGSVSIIERLSIEDLIKVMKKR